MVAIKIIVIRMSKEWTPSEFYFAGKYIMLVGGVVASVGTSDNFFVVSSTLSAFCSIVKDVFRNVHLEYIPNF